MGAARYNRDMDIFARLGVTKEQLADFCRRAHIRRLAAFGSVLRDDFSPESDIDLLAEFEPGVWVGLRYFEIKKGLEAMLGRHVDLLSREYLRSAYREEILSSAEDVYVAA